MSPEAQRWLGMGDYDLGVARLCFDNGIYVYCGFFCHLALEKLLKAIVLDKLGLEEPPYTHSLGALADMIEVDDLPDEYVKFLIELSPHSVSTRYAESLSEYSKDWSQNVLVQTQEVYS
jgi:HEPN domain-containing protein